MLVVVLDPPMDQGFNSLDLHRSENNPPGSSWPGSCTHHHADLSDVSVTAHHRESSERVETLDVHECHTVG